MLPAEAFVFCVCVLKLQSYLLEFAVADALAPPEPLPELLPELASVVELAPPLPEPDDGGTTTFVVVVVVDGVEAGAGTTTVFVTGAGLITVVFCGGGLLWSEQPEMPAASTVMAAKATVTFNEQIVLLMVPPESE